MYFEEIKDIKLLSPEEEKICDKETLILSNLRLVIFIAKKYWNEELDFLDLIQEGNIGLILAANKFDPEKGRFSTFAFSWIQKQILEAVSRSDIKMPKDLQSKVNKFNTFKNQYYTQFGVLPPDDIVKEYFGEQDLDLNLTKTYIEEDEGDDIPTSITPLDYAEKNILKETLTNIMVCLTPREQKVVKLRFGFDDEEPKTFEEIGNIMGFSLSTARRTLDTALKKLQNPIIKNAIRRQYEI